MEPIPVGELVANKAKVISAYKNGIPADKIRDMARYMIAMLSSHEFNLTADYTEIVMGVLAKRTVYGDEVQARLIFSLLAGKYYTEGVTILMTYPTKWSLWAVLHYMAITTTSDKILRQTLLFRYKKLLATLMIIFKMAGNVNVACELTKTSGLAYLEILYVASLYFNIEQLTTLVRVMIQYTNHLPDYTYKYFLTNPMVTAVQSYRAPMRTAAEVIDAIKLCIQQPIIDNGMFSKEFIDTFDEANTRVHQALLNAGMAPTEEELKTSRQRPVENEEYVGPMGIAYNYGTGTSKNWSEITDPREAATHLEELVAKRKQLLKKIKQLETLTDRSDIERRKRVMEVVNSVVGLVSGSNFGTTITMSDSSLERLRDQLRTIEIGISIVKTKLNVDIPEDESSDDDIITPITLTQKRKEERAAKKAKPQESDDDIPMMHAKKPTKEDSEDDIPITKAKAVSSPTEKSIKKHINTKPTIKKVAGSDSDEEKPKISKISKISGKSTKKDVKSDSEDDIPTKNVPKGKKVVSDSSDEDEKPKKPAQKSIKKPVQKKVVPKEDNSDEDPNNH